MCINKIAGTKPVHAWIHEYACPNLSSGFLQHHKPTENIQLKKDFAALSRDSFINTDMNIQREQIFFSKAFNGIARVEITKHEFSTGAQCSICWEDFAMRETVWQLKCGHLFHSDCIAPWFRSRHRTCPFCRAEDVYTPPSRIMQNFIMHFHYVIWIYIRILLSAAVYMWYYFSRPYPLERYELATAFVLLGIISYQLALLFCTFLGLDHKRHFACSIFLFFLGYAITVYCSVFYGNIVAWVGFMSSSYTCLNVALDRQRMAS